VRRLDSGAIRKIAAEEDWEFSQFDDRKTRSILTISRETIHDAIL
jgi:hypothetical protein